jgi:hypothetical protein
MLPTDPLKIDLRRLEVVLSAAGFDAAPAERVLEVSMVDPFIVFVKRAQALPDRAIAGAVPRP